MEGLIQLFAGFGAGAYAFIGAKFYKELWEEGLEDAPLWAKSLFALLAVAWPLPILAIYAERSWWAWRHWRRVKGGGVASVQGRRKLRRSSGAPTRVKAPPPDATLH